MALNCRRPSACRAKLANSGAEPRKHLASMVFIGRRWSTSDGLALVLVDPRGPPRRRHAEDPSPCAKLAGEISLMPLQPPPQLGQGGWTSSHPSEPRGDRLARGVTPHPTPIRNASIEARHAEPTQSPSTTGLPTSSIRSMSKRRAKRRAKELTEAQRAEEIRRTWETVEQIEQEAERPAPSKRALPDYIRGVVSGGLPTLGRRRR